MSLDHNPDRQIVSNAFWQSMKAQNNFFFLEKNISISHFILNTWSTVEYVFLNPVWFSFKILCVSRNFSSLWFRRLVKKLAWKAAVLTTTLGPPPDLTLDHCRTRRRCWANVAPVTYLVVRGVVGDFLPLSGWCRLIPCGMAAGWVHADTLLR